MPDSHTFGGTSYASPCHSIKAWWKRDSRSSSLPLFEVALIALQPAAARSAMRATCGAGLQPVLMDEEMETRLVSDWE